MDDNSLVEEENMTPTTEYQYPDLPPFNTRLENYIILTLLFIFISIIDFTISICLWLYYDKKIYLLLIGFFILVTILLFVGLFKKNKICLISVCYFKFKSLLVVKYLFIYNTEVISTFIVLFYSNE